MKKVIQWLISKVQKKSPASPEVGGYQITYTLASMYTAVITVLTPHSEEKLRKYLNERSDWLAYEVQWQTEKDKLNIYLIHCKNEYGNMQIAGLSKVFLAIGKLGIEVETIEITIT